MAGRVLVNAAADATAVVGANRVADATAGGRLTEVGFQFYGLDEFFEAV